MNIKDLRSLKKWGLVEKFNIINILEKNIDVILRRNFL